MLLFYQVWTIVTLCTMESTQAIQDNSLRGPGGGGGGGGLRQNSLEIDFVVVSDGGE